MSILAFCYGCNQYYSRKHDDCPKCKINLKNSKKFRVNVSTPEGGRITRIVEGNLTLARKVEAKVKTDVSKEKHLGIRVAPFIYDVWKKYLKWAKKNKSSWQADESRWNHHIAPYIELKKMDSVYGSHVQKILDRMVEKGGRDGKGCAPGTIKQVYQLINKVYNWADEQDLYAGKNPTAKIKPPEVNNEITEYLREDEPQRLLDVLDSWHNRLGALVVKFALYTGFRLDDILGLKWKKVDIENGFARLSDPKGKPVTLPLNNQAQNIIKQAKELKPSPDCPYVFPNRFGKRRVSFSNIWYRIRAKAKIRGHVRFHDLRHTFASYLASSGDVDIYTLQKLLNQQSPEMTQRYAHLFNDALRKGANVADKVFGNGNKAGNPES